jgi:hypothetical protein
MFVTITPQNSVYSTGIARVLAEGDDLTLLSGSYLAGGHLGLDLLGSNTTTIFGEVSGRNTAIRAGSDASILVGASGVISGDILADGGTLALSVLGQVYGDVHFLGHRITFQNSGLIDGTVDLVADRSLADLHIHGQITGPLTVEAHRTYLDLEGATLSGVTVLADEIYLSGHDIHAQYKVVLQTKGLPFPFGPLTANDLDGSRFDRGLVFRANSGVLVDLDGVFASFLTIGGGGSYIELGGSDIKTAVITTDDAQIDARGSLGLHRMTLGIGNDLLYGNDLGQYITDHGGVDHVILGAGDDTYVAQRTNTGKWERLNGGAGFDTLVLTDLKSGVVIDLGRDTVGLRGHGGAQGATFISCPGFEWVTGGLGRDVVLGSADADTASGGPGDRLFGGLGDDTLMGQDAILRGGGGADQFLFRSYDGAQPGTTLIRDFTQGEDVIDLSKLNRSSRFGGDPDLVFLGEGTFTAPDGRQSHLSYVHAHGQTVISVDVLGSWPLDHLTITLAGTLTLTEADFLL